MPISTASNSSKSWKDYFLKSKNITYSNDVLAKIRESVSITQPFLSSVRDISKNPGIAFISLDASEEKIQLFHHVSVIGGSWTEETEKLVGILGTGQEVTPIQIMPKSIKDIKGKSYSFDQLAEKLQSKELLVQDRSAKSTFHYPNLLPIPVLLTQVFIGLEETDPFSVATAFMQAMYQFDSEGLLAKENHDDHEKANPEENQEDVEHQGEEIQTEINKCSMDEDQRESETTQNSFTEEFVHILQFCHLCSIKVVTPVLYTLWDVQPNDPWLLSVYSSLGLNVAQNSKRAHANDSPSSQDEKPITKSSRMDEHLINTMRKIHESFDNNLTKSMRDKEEKEPGFKRLEYHKKNLILNASASPPFDQAADEPTEFYRTFLQKKTQFKAKEFLMHRLQIDNISFHPSSSFVNCLWNADFLWLTPDFPTGISIFFCPEVSSVNSYELERDRNLALVDKIKQSDIEKLSKEKFSFPESIMDMVWLTQNYHSIVALCFGENSHSAKFLKDWGNHMYSNRLLYKSQQASDSSFFTQVLFCIDRALQIHWKSCCENSDRESINDRVLLMSGKRDLIIQYNFSYNIPKLLQDKLTKPKPTDTSDKDEKNKDGKGNNGKVDKDNKNKFKSWKDIVTDNDPKHAHWHIQEGENFSRLFYSNQKKCPKTKEGKLICMKLFIRGICDKSCTRVHKLTTEDEKAFDNFVGRCREGGAGKPDF